MTRSTGQRGVALVYVTVLGFVFFALVVVGIDLGHLALTATEVQTVAEVGATAGARAIMTGGDGLAQARTVVSKNAVNATWASITPGEFEIGNFNGVTRTFAPDGEPENAVRVTASATVLNFMAGIFGDFASTVRKQSTAAFLTIGSGTPGFPLALKDCDAQCTSSGQCDLGDLNQVPNQGNSFWTSLSSTTEANPNNVGDLIPRPSSCGCAYCGGGDAPPLLKVGDVIRLNNGQDTSHLFQETDCLLGGASPQDTFVIPMLSCGNVTSTQGTVSGFATVQIECVYAPGVVNKSCAAQAMQCRGGSTPGQICTTSTDCGGTCSGKGGTKTCTGTTKSCKNNNDCQGVCQVSSLCSGGTNAGTPCTSDSDCPGGKCGGGSKYLKLHAIFNSGVPGTPGGCSGCGTGYIGLVG